MTKAQWETEVVWNLEQAVDILHRLSTDANASAGRALAHARVADSIAAALDSKRIG